MSGRIRTIKPELLEDEKVASLADDEFRLFIGLFLVADDYGNFRANPTWLHGQVFWAREGSRGARECLTSLREVGLVVLYEENTQHYGHICGWSKHQKIDRPSKPKIPGPTAENIERKPNVGQPREGSRVNVEGSTNPSLGSGSGSGSGKGSGRECEGNQPGGSGASSTDENSKPEVANAPPAIETEPKEDGRKHRLPDDWKPNDSHKAKAKDLGLDVAAEAEAFSDHHQAHGSTMVKWDKAFFTWLRNAVRFGAAPQTKDFEPDFIETPSDYESAPAMTLAEAARYAPEECRKPIQEFLEGFR